jgi:hypothetical protein
MDKGREATGVNNRDKEDSTWARVSLYTNQHGQPGINILESRIIDRSREAICVSGGDI